MNPRYPTADHIVPLALGGSLLDPENGRAARLQPRDRLAVRLYVPTSVGYGRSRERSQAPPIGGADNKHFCRRHTGTT